MRTSQASQLVALLVLGTLAISSAQNVSMVLANYPQFSTFAKLMQDTGVINEVQSRSSLTILLPDNGILDAYVGSHPSYTTQMVADVIRYHSLLQYFGGEELAALTSEGLTVTTLYQSTGRANDLDGFVNLTRTASGTVTVGPSTPLSPPQANIVTNVTQYPYNYSFIQISAVLEPLGLAAAQLAPSTPPSMAPTPVPSMEPIMAPSMTPMMPPSMTPMMPPSMTPSNTPTMAPSMTPEMAPSMTPMMPPSMTPTEAPVAAPVKAPVESPVETPVESPVETPAETPTTAEPPVAEGPPADSPASPTNSGFAVRSNAVAVVASLAVAALFL